MFRKRGKVGRVEAFEEERIIERFREDRTEMSGAICLSFDEANCKRMRSRLNINEEMVRIQRMDIVQC